MYIGPHDVIHPHDARVVEPRGRARLAERALAHLVALLRGQSLRRDELFDGDVSVQHLIARQPDATHASLAERADQPVALGEEGLRNRHLEKLTRSGPGHAKAPRPFTPAGFVTWSRGPARSRTPTSPRTTAAGGAGALRRVALQPPIRS